MVALNELSLMGVILLGGFFLLYFRYFAFPLP